MVISHDAALEAEIRRATLFSALNEKQLELVLASGQQHALDVDDTLFEQGQPANRFYWLRAGSVKLSRLAPSGEEKIIEIVSPGQTFAEALMFMGTECAYPVTAQTLMPSELIGFDNATFLSALRGSVDTCFRLMAAMSQRLHGLVSEIDQLTLRSATARVADFLMAKASDEGEVALEIPKHAVASRLSIKPETLSRIFSRMSSQGILSVSGSRITIKDAGALRTLVDVEA